jgi:hypothetical protein
MKKPEDQGKKSFMVNADGTADAYHINLEEIVKRVNREQTQLGDW